MNNCTNMVNDRNIIHPATDDQFIEKVNRVASEQIKSTPDELEFVKKYSNYHVEGDITLKLNTQMTDGVVELTNYFPILTTGKINTIVLENVPQGQYNIVDETSATFFTSKMEEDKVVFHLKDFNIAIECSYFIVFPKKAIQCLDRMFFINFTFTESYKPPLRIQWLPNDYHVYRLLANRRCYRLEIETQYDYSNTEIHMYALGYKYTSLGYSDRIYSYMNLHPKKRYNEIGTINKLYPDEVKQKTLNMSRISLPIVICYNDEIKRVASRTFECEMGVFGSKIEL